MYLDPENQSDLTVLDLKEIKYLFHLKQSTFLIALSVFLTEIVSDT